MFPDVFTAAVSIVIVDPQLPKGTGVSVVERLMEVLKAVVLKLQSFETVEPKAMEGQEGEDLFLEVGAGGKDNKDEV